MKSSKGSTGKAQPRIQSFFVAKSKPKSSPTDRNGVAKTSPDKSTPDHQHASDATVHKEGTETVDQVKRARQEDDIEIVDEHETATKRQKASQPRQDARDPMREALAKRKFAIRRQQLVEEKKGPVPTKNAKYTPLEQQVVELKKKHPGLILIVECGYKFRFFGEDAEVASKNLNIYSYADHNFMTASVPIHRLSCHVQRLVRKGFKVAVARQMETAALKAASESRNKVFVRKVTAVYTPSTLEAGVFEDSAAEAAEDDQPADITPSYLFAVSEAQPSGSTTGGVTFTAVEPAFSTIWWGSSDGHVASSTLESMLMYFQPKEILACGDLSPAVQRMLKAFVGANSGTSLENVDVKDQSPAAAAQELVGMFEKGTQAADSIAAAVPTLPVGVVECMTASFSYLKSLGLEVWNELGLKLQSMEQPGVMNLSSNAVSNLRVFVGDDGSPSSSLFRLLCRTRTQAGAKLFRQWLASPLVDFSAIRERQDAVQSLLDDVDLLSNVQEALQACPDVDRSIGRAFLQRIKPSEFCTAMAVMVDMPAKLLGAADGVSGDKQQGMEKYLPGASLLLQSCLQAACDAEMVKAARAQLAQLDPGAAKENNFTSLFSSEQDFPEVFECQRDLQEREKALQSLLPSLAKAACVSKVTYTSIMNQGDCLIELPVDLKAPASWTRICGTKKVNRYRPPEVADAMAERDQSSEKLQAQCKQSWAEHLQRFGRLCPMFRAAAHGLAVLDCLQSLAAGAATPDSCRPEILDDDPRATENPADTPAISGDTRMQSSPCTELRCDASDCAMEDAAGACDGAVGGSGCAQADGGDGVEALIEVRAGRAPLLDDLLPQGAVPNDVVLRGNGLRAMCISGPNMGGKSSYMCQVAQLVLMAQMGAWVPAEAMRLRPVDAIHTRMGAHDNILQGRSTFLEELVDASHLLAASTPRSLVILDELGRGTSTHDGVAIATATLEYLVKVTRCCALFVTHYPEVCLAADAMAPHAQSFHMGYKASGTWDLGGKSGLRDATTGTSEAASQGNENISGADNGGQAPESAGHDRGEEMKAQTVEVPKMIFLYKVAPGAAGASFGLNVALMAGLPPSVITRASTIARTGVCPAPASQIPPGPADATVAPVGDTTRSAGASSKRSDLVSLLRDVMLLKSDASADNLITVQEKVKQSISAGK